LAYFDFEFGFYCPRKPCNPIFGGENCNISRRQDGAGLILRVIKGRFCLKYPLILRYSDWLVLEIITQWTGKTIV
jgi:hypothetical protein